MTIILVVSVSPSNINHIRETFKKCVDMSKKEKDKLVVNNEKLLKTQFNRDCIINNLTNQLIHLSD